MIKISPFLWFDNNAEEAMNFYISVFKNSKVLGVTHYGDAGPGVPGSIMTASLQLEDQEITLLNGGPYFKFSEAFSFYVTCDTQEEVDWYWNKLSEGGEESQCGWLKDKYGLSWQIVPKVLVELMGSPDPVRSQRVMKILLQMRKLDVATLQRAYDEG